MADANPPSPSSSGQHRSSALRDDSDLDPAAFLKSVRELSEKRDREDVERYRKLEAEVQKGREERAARRAERARSISPEKQSQSQQSAASTPAHRNLPRNTTNASLLSSPPVALTPQSPARPNETSPTPSLGMEPEKRASSDAEDVPDFKGFGSIKRSSATSSRSSSQAGADSSATTSPSASNLARSGTLSWQQRPRPGSKLGGSRPLSMASAEGSAHSSKPSADEPEPSRDQIAASLGARDPSWFRQTADRGVGNAAFRRSKEETAPSETAFSGRRGLPGISRELSMETERHAGSPTSESQKSETVSRGDSLHESTLSNNSSRYSATSTSSSKPDLKTLIAVDEEQRRASPSFDQASTASGDSGTIARILTMSSSQGRLSAIDRPASPTKGMGGFVQSAMMKRSDSQSKRWSAQPPTALSRQGSAASSRGGFGGIQGSHSMPRLEPTVNTRDSNEGAPPSSSHHDLSSLVTGVEQDKDGFVKPALPHHSRSKSTASNYSANDDGPIPPSPGSPSKRWSPNKSSWLESSLTRPESPKPAPSKNAQPSWMADLAKAKAQRASQDLTSLPGKPGEDDDLKLSSRPSSPSKTTPFGPALLRRSQSRPESALGDPTPKRGESVISRPESPMKDMPSGTASPKPSESPALPKTPQPTTPTNKTKPLQVADKFTSSPAGVSQSSKPENPIPRQLPEPGVAKASDRTSVEGQPTHSTTSAPEPMLEQPRQSQNVSKPPAPVTPPKPSTDLRSQLKSRPRGETKTNDEPEFLSKFGNLRKTQQEKYVAPDVLKNNILRGKSGLALTGGPVKTERKDELKESLLAKKDDWKKAKDEGRELPGQVHERKISATKAPEAPSKPEALVKKDLLSRSDSSRVVSPAERVREAMPEALVRQKSLTQKPITDSVAKEATGANFPLLHKQISAPSAMETRASKDTSKLAARFNPGLASILARGPPSNTPSRSASPVAAGQMVASPTEPLVAGAPLQDMRKDRAKGPKRRKGGAKTEMQSTESTIAESPQAEEPSLTQTQTAISETVPSSEQRPSSLRSNAGSLGSLNKSPRPISVGPYAQEPEQESTPIIASQARSKPQATPGSAGSLMRASLTKTSQTERKDQLTLIDKAALSHDGAADKPSPPAKSPLLAAKESSTVGKSVSGPPPVQVKEVPEFKGFGAARAQRSSQISGENKENSGDNSPSVKSAASQWGQRPGPSQIQLPTKKDEEEAMRSAGLLASNSSRSRIGLGMSADQSGDRLGLTPPASVGLPPKPMKSSRTVSGQLAEASPNKDMTIPGPCEADTNSEAGQFLASTFGSVPKCNAPLAIDTSATLSMSNQSDAAREIRTLRKSIEIIFPEGLSQALPPQEEYTFFDESTYVCTHVCTTQGVKNTQVFVWAGDATSETAIEMANTLAKRVAKENGSGQIQVTRQGQEMDSFLQALGGIFITRRGARAGAPKQFMLCGRKHRGHIVFDEVDFAVDTLCSGFVYLISYPVTLQETKLYLWKGQACSPEELSAARLAAMDLSETGEIIEVDGGVEFTSFLKIFGAHTTKWNITKPSELWRQKSTCPGKFTTRLYRIQQAETKTGLLTTLWNRRPSWNSMSPARSPARDDEIKVEAKEMTSLTQAQLEAEGIYMLDAYHELYILIGPLLASQPQKLRDALLGQTLLFASDYAIVSASMEDRPMSPKGFVVVAGVPRDVKMLFRHWDNSQGLWGTASLMAGSMSNMSSGREVKLVPLEDMLRAVRRE